MKYILLFVLLSSFSNIYCQIDTLSARTRVDQMPFFSGCTGMDSADPAKRKCSDEALEKFTSEHLVYPPGAIEKKLEGTVVVGFTIDENGKISDEKVLRDIGEKCGEAALSLVRAMPNWEPARHKGKPVKMKLTLPVRFFFKTLGTNEGDAYSIHWGKLRGQKVGLKTLKDAVNDQLLVRDPFGNAVKVNELSFVFEKKRKSSDARVSGAVLNKSMKKIVKKASAGGTFTITAAIQNEGKLVFVTRSYEVTE